MPTNPYAPPATESRRRRKWLRPTGIEWYVASLGLISLVVTYGLFPLLYAIVAFLDTQFTPTMGQVLKIPFILGSISAAISCGAAACSWLIRNWKGEWYATQTD